MGLFSIFWVGEPRRPCGWPAEPELEAAPAFTQVSFGVAAFTRFVKIGHPAFPRHHPGMTGSIGLS
jgi:hypothetical protein